MLTDIFAHRYQKYSIWQGYSDLEQRLLNQAIKLVLDVLPLKDANDKEI